MSTREQVDLLKYLIVTIFSLAVDASLLRSYMHDVQREEFDF